MRHAAVVFVVALLLHIGYFVCDTNSWARDSPKYVVPAENVIAGHGYTRGGVAETERTPGYPLVLMVLRLIGLTFRQIALLQHVACALAAAGLVLLVRSITGNEFVAVVSGIVTAIDLPAIHHANLILTETTCMLLALALFAMMWRLAHGGGRPIAAGLLLGAMVLVRPVAMFLFLPLAVFLAWTRRDSVRRVVPLFVASSLLLPAIWLARNFHVSGVPTLSTNSAVLLLDFHGAGTLAIGDPGDFDTNFVRRQVELRKIADARARAAFGVSDVATIPYVQRAAIDSRLGREVVLAHPFAFLRLFCRGIAADLLGGGTEALVGVTPLSRVTASRLLLVYTSLALLLAIIGEASLLRHQRVLGVLVLIFVGYFIAFTAGALSYSRFRVPILPMYSMAVAAGVQVLRQFR
ncbi:MAG TPA: glycosyltransferase family 39 protein [Thermoanaerobaculia bacterium]|nr:glycosyltransferase family 39 protein [Thermoanaerobaculia bacterium]